MTLTAPPLDSQLDALRDLAAELPIASTEPVLVERALDIISTLLPGREIGRAHV